MDASIRVKSLSSSKLLEIYEGQILRKKFLIKKKYSENETIRVRKGLREKLLYRTVILIKFLSK